MKTFKPQLCPNDEINLNDLSYPLLASTKLDGCRLLIHNGELLTRSLKPLKNKQLREKFQKIADFTKEEEIILDGECYAHGIPFQFIVSCFMTQDYDDIKAIKKWTNLCQEHDYFISRQEMLDKLKFYCFDCLDDGMLNDCYFSARYKAMLEYTKKFPELIVPVIHKEINNSDELSNYFEEAVNRVYEGLILRNPNGLYKYGRCRISEQNSYKVKPWVTIDSKIIGIVQATVVNDDVEKTVTELGFSRTSKKQGDRHLINKANAFIVDYEGKELHIPIAMTDEQKLYIWEHQNEYIGKFVEYKFMKIGMKENGLPRIPKMLRMRFDKE